MRNNSDSTTDHPFDVATETDKQVNQMLAETDGRICTMEFSGAIGYHLNVATGESDPEYLWKLALLQAFDETVFEMMHVDAKDAATAREQIETQLEDSFRPLAVESVADVFEEKLADLVETQEAKDE
ncbi:hypothetical protein ELS19_04480 [Halogeometricum borinquense]|uniref:Uncharacterized protein n=1 Tax=Halogeometricum borinquense TaxID=60847 RepID=A0A482TK42_9EURY|nr:hypothetical protein [Halogeometricum borinquense]RYJ13295.1 hypothetical protein ELS19_04480 [Halogeometricum borinquense]